MIWHLWPSHQNPTEDKKVVKLQMVLKEVIYSLTFAKYLGRVTKTYNPHILSYASKQCLRYENVSYSLLLSILSFSWWLGIVPPLKFKLHQINHGNFFTMRLAGFNWTIILSASITVLITYVYITYILWFM